MTVSQLVRSKLHDYVTFGSVSEECAVMISFNLKAFGLPYPMSNNRALLDAAHFVPFFNASR